MGSPRRTQLVEAAAVISDHVWTAGEYFPSHIRLAIATEAAACLDVCPVCAEIEAMSLAPGSDVFAALVEKKGHTALSQAGATLPAEVVLAIHAVTNLQSKVSAKGYESMTAIAARLASVPYAPSDDTLLLHNRAARGAVMEFVAVVAVTCGLTVLQAAGAVSGGLPAWSPGGPTQTLAPATEKEDLAHASGWAPVTEGSWRNFMAPFGTDGIGVGCT